MASTLAALAVVGLAFLLLAWLLNGKNKDAKKKLPPGPKGLPIIGSLHLLGKYPYRSFHKLAQKYGPIMYLKLGYVPTVVVSSPQAAELFLKTHDLVFANRPPSEAAQAITYGESNLSFAPYGSYWRNMRKLCTLELLSSLKINSFGPMRREELGLLIEEIKIAALQRVAFNISAAASALSANMSCRMIFGKKYMDEELGDKGFKEVVQEDMLLTGSFNLGDYIPLLARLDLQGIAKRAKAINKVYDDFFEKVFEEHIQNKDEKKKDGKRNKDFVDIMLQYVGSEESDYRINRSNVKALMIEMLVASVDTSATVIEWALSEIVKDPRVMKKIQKELEEKIGMDRKVEESDLESLEYLKMVVKETFRLHPVAPMLLPHHSVEDCIVDGLFIPKNSQILINVWAIGRDPNAWNIDPDKFWPERFAGMNVDVRGHDFQLIPFGGGRRMCPGMQLGLAVVHLVIAQLVHCFDWELPNGMLPTELDMTEEFSLVTPRAKPLLAIPTYRLSN